MEDVVNVSCCEKSVKTKYENQVSIKTEKGAKWLLQKAWILSFVVMLTQTITVFINTLLPRVKASYCGKKRSSTLGVPARLWHPRPLQFGLCKWLGSES